MHFFFAKLLAGLALLIRRFNVGLQRHPAGASRTSPPDAPAVHLVGGLRTLGRPATQNSLPGLHFTPHCVQLQRPHFVWARGASHWPSATPLGGCYAGGQAALAAPWLRCFTP
jgi:hypothetical protein